VTPSLFNFGGVGNDSVPLDIGARWLRNRFWREGLSMFGEGPKREQNIALLICLGGERGYSSPHPEKSITSGGPIYLKNRDRKTYKKRGGGREQSKHKPGERVTRSGHRGEQPHIPLSKEV